MPLSDVVNFTNGNKNLGIAPKSEFRDVPSPIRGVMRETIWRNT